MADWRYIIIGQYGNRAARQKTCQRIKQAVEYEGLWAQLPQVRYELGPKGEYCLGLAVNIPDADEEDVPLVVRKVFERAGVQYGERFWPVKAAEVVTFFKGGMDCDSFTIPITYEDSQNSTPIDWFQISQQMEWHPSDNTDSADDRFDRLLWWCSAVGSGDANRLRDACNHLGIHEAAEATWPLLRKMVLLGHLEYKVKGKLTWAMTEPTLVQRAGMPDEYFLTGQRSPDYVSSLGYGRQVEVIAQNGAPQRLTVQMSSGLGSLKLCGRPVRSAGCASELLAWALPSLSKWAELFPVWEERDFARYQVERYCIDTDKLLPLGVFGNPSEGFYRFQLDTDKGTTKVNAYYDAGIGRWYGGDFYGLRFLARMRASKCEARWHAPTRELFVPARDRWPMPYERALVLASGLLPRVLKVSSGEKLLAYSALTEPLAQQLFALLGIDWKVTDE